MIAAPLRAAALRTDRTKLTGLTLWPSDRGWQASVRFSDRGGWTVETDPDPVLAILRTLGAEPPAPQPKIPSIFD